MIQGTELLTLNLGDAHQILGKSCNCVVAIAGRAVDNDLVRTEHAPILTTKSGRADVIVVSAELHIWSPGRHLAKKKVMTTIPCT